MLLGNKQRLPRICQQPLLQGVDFSPPLLVLQLSDLREVTSVNWCTIICFPTLLWPFIGFLLGICNSLTVIKLCPCLMCAMYGFTNRITMCYIPGSFFLFHACTAFLLGKRETESKLFFFFEDAFHSRNFVNGVRLVWWLEVKRNEDGDFGVKGLKLKCLPGWFFLSSPHVSFWGIFSIFDSCS